MIFRTRKDAKSWAKANLRGKYYRLVTSYVNAERGYETKIALQSRPFSRMNDPKVYA